MVRPKLLGPHFLLLLRREALLLLAVPTAAVPLPWRGSRPSLAAKCSEVYYVEKFSRGGIRRTIDMCNRIRLTCAPEARRDDAADVPRHLLECAEQRRWSAQPSRQQMPRASWLAAWCSCGTGQQANPLYVSGGSEVS